MNDVRLPALTGDSPLGILAACGVLRLLTDFTQDQPTLRWDPNTLTAVIGSRRESVDDVLADLQSIATAIPDSCVLPGVGPDFPPPGAAPDRLRILQPEFRDESGRLLSGRSQDEVAEAQRWLGSLVTDLAVDAQKGRVAISQYTAPAGKQSMATMLGKPLELIKKKPDYLRQALVSWRRVNGVTGEYLDHRAMWDATEDGRGGTGTMRGVPGSTWLALMAFPLFLTTASEQKRPVTSGWHVVMENRRRHDELRLPVWRQPLGTAAVVALVEHPALTGDDKAFTRRSASRRTQQELDGLGIIHICRARRNETTGKSAGVLTTMS